MSPPDPPQAPVPVRNLSASTQGNIRNQAPTDTQPSRNWERKSCGCAVPATGMTDWLVCMFHRGYQAGVTSRSGESA